MQERRDFAGEYSHYTNRGIGRFAFSYALLASFIWHLFWLFSVTVFVTPMTFTKCLTSNVTFLGGILDEESISIHERPDEIVGRTEINRQPQPAIYDVLIARNADIKYIGGPIFKSEFDMLKEKEVKLTAIGELTGMKQIPQRQFDKVKVSYKTYPLQVKGPVRFREVVYRPKLPNYLRWDEELGVDLDRLGDSFEMELKFWVSPEGRVEFVERVSSSGHPTVDLVGIRYLKGWQFAPLVVGESKDEQWGIVKLNFNLTKELK